MKIYWFKAQSPRRVLALAKHLKLRDVETVEIDIMNGGLEAPDYVALNPNKKAPTLVDGAKVLWETSAIMVYLASKAGSDMWPATKPEEQVEVMRWLSWNNCHWARSVGNFYFENHIKAVFGMGEPDQEALEKATPELKKLAKILDDHLAKTPYAACGRLTIADFQLASMATDWKQCKMPFEDFPNIQRWLDRLNELPAWRDPWPSSST